MTDSVLLVGLLLTILFLVGLSAKACIISIWRPRLQRAAMTERAWPLVSIVLPLHNEETRVDRCLRLLSGQNYESLELVLVLDRCTDGTRDVVSAAMARDSRVRCVEVSDCPDGWSGKCHAAARGASTARGEWLLFTDGDTEHNSELLASAVTWSEKRQLGLLSLLSRLPADRIYERLIQPIVASVMGTLYGLEPSYRLDRAGLSGALPLMVNGQFMLFSASGYRAIGGHAAVKDALCEDLAFARLAKRVALRHQVLLAEQWLTCRMYTSFSTFRAGWRRILIEACERSPSKMVVLAIALSTLAVLLVLLPITCCLAEVGAFGLHSPWALSETLRAMIACAVALELFSGAMIWRLNGVWVPWCLLAPLGAAAVAEMLLSGAWMIWRGASIRWGGRTYALRRCRDPQSPAA